MARSAATQMNSAIIFFFILQQVLLGSCLRLTHFEVPPHVERYTNQTLSCEYDIGKEKLYSIKWFFNDKEFFSFKPSQTPQKQAFDNSKLDVITEESTGPTVVLREVDLSATGEYKCQVTRDTQDFLADDRRANMTVVVIPNDRPSIEGDVDGHYHVDDFVNLNCTAAPSIPAATLVWLINDAAAPKEYVREYEHQKTEEGLFISTVGLFFKLAESDFKQGELKLKCTATIAALYHKVEEHSQVNPTGTVVRDLPAEGSLVTANGPGSGSEAMLNGVLHRLLFLHAVLLFSVHLLQ